MAPRRTNQRDEPFLSENGDKSVKNFEAKIVPRNVVLFIILHLCSIYGVYLIFTSAQKKTTFFAWLLYVGGGLGITAGAHRLWSHRSYKARFPFRLFLVILNCISGQNDIYDWCRDHRVHHKFTETDADPYNITRGFFFAHIGWLLCKKHPQVMEKGKTVLLDDLLKDPLIRFQRKYYIPLEILINVFLPTMIPVWFWNESVWNSYFICFMLRYCFLLNVTWLVNSAAHMYGNKPFDHSIWAAENPSVAVMTFGEGWHNYHHVFPWDYSASELGYTLNVTKLLIDFMALIGQAYDLKVAHPHLVKNTKLKTGDGTRIKQSDIIPETKEGTEIKQLDITPET